MACATPDLRLPSQPQGITALERYQISLLGDRGTERWGVGMVICLERGADLHMAQLMPLPLTVSCFSKIQIGFTFLVPAHPGSPGKRAVKWWCVSMAHTAGHEKNKASRGLVQQL